MNDTNNQSHEVEGQLVGSILKDGKIFPRIHGTVNPANFHSINCKDIYEAMIAVYKSGLVIDQVTVGDYLERNNKTIRYGQFNGRTALSAFRDLGNPRNADSYALLVQDYWGKREIEYLANKFVTWSRNGRPAMDILTDARNLFDEIDSQISDSSSRTVDATVAASRSYDETVRASQGAARFVKTGLDLDHWFRMRDGNLTVIAARPGLGKTALLVTIALNNAMDKKKREVKGKILFLSMEMTVEEVTARFLSQVSRVPTQRILDGEMTQDEWNSYNEAVTVFEGLPIAINDLPAMNLSSIRGEVQRHLRDSEENLLIVDYLQLATSGLNKQNRVDEVGAVARGLKVLAGTTKMPVIAAAALSRAIEIRADKRPLLSDLRESGSIEADANNVVFVHESSAPTMKKLIVAKQRNGATSNEKGDIELAWLSSIMRFENLERHK